MTTKLNLEMEDELVSGDGSISDATNNDSGDNKGEEEDNSSKLARMKKRREANLCTEEDVKTVSYTQTFGKGGSIGLPATRAA